MSRAAVFLDRDGNINRDVGYPNSYRSIDIYGYSFEAVRKLNQAGLSAIVITNQSGVGRGLIEESQLREIHARMSEDFLRQGARIDAFYYCPHYTYSSDPRYKKDCSCRKPFPEMGLRAAQDLDLDLNRSYVVGDKVEDILFGQNIGANPILVLTGYGETSRLRLMESEIHPAFIAAHLLEAVLWILARENPGGKVSSDQGGRR